METTEKRTPGRSLRKLAVALGLALLAGLLLAGPAAGVKKPAPQGPWGDVYSPKPRFNWTNGSRFGILRSARLRRRHRQKTEAQGPHPRHPLHDCGPAQRGPALLGRPGVDPHSVWADNQEWLVAPASFHDQAAGVPHVRVRGPERCGVIDENAHTIVVTVPMGTDRSALTPYFTSWPRADVMVSGIAQHSGEGSVNFTNPVRYTLIAAGPLHDDRGSTNYYDVTVKVAASPAKAITAFSFQGLSSPATGVIDETAHTIAVQVLFGTNVTALIATFTTTGSSVTVNGGLDQRRHAQQLHLPRRLHRHGRRRLDAGVHRHRHGQREFPEGDHRLQLPAARAAGRWGHQPAAHTIAAQVLFGTNVSALIATFTTTGSSVTVNGLPQTSSVTPNNFTQPVTYLVTAADGTDAGLRGDRERSPATRPRPSRRSASGPLPPVTGAIDQPDTPSPRPCPHGTLSR